MLIINLKNWQLLMRNWVTTGAIKDPLPFLIDKNKPYKQRSLTV